MARFTPLIVTLVASAVVGFGKTPSPAMHRDAELPTALGFERPGTEPIELGWGGGPGGTLFIDDTVVHSGRHSVRLERTATSQGQFTALTGVLPVDFSGKSVELHGFLRTEDVTGFAGLWMREDGATPSLAFDNMQQRQLQGTTDWQEYTISLPLHPEARKLFFGILLEGTGRTWGDDLQLLVDGKPIWLIESKPIRLAPASEHTVLDTDHEFDAGSSITVGKLTLLQVSNLATLARVWGFLKYHHPRVTAGALHWDYELFRVMPTVLSAKDRETAEAAISAWITRLGELKPGSDPKLPEGVYLRPDLAWIDDQRAVGEALRAQLHAVHAARPAHGAQFYVSLTPQVGNPVFAHELTYSDVKLPDPGYQLLGLFRFWNVYRYWSPYRDLVEGDWDATLSEFIPRFAAAATRAEYQRAFLALISRVHDTHANLWSGVRERPPVGNLHLPVLVRFVEGQATVTRLLPEGGTAGSGLQRGDVLQAIDGVPVEKLVEEWAPYYAASNEPTRLRDIARNLGQGTAATAHLRVKRGDTVLDLDVARVKPAAGSGTDRLWHDLPGEAFRLLSPEVAYLKLSAAKVDDIDHYVKQALGTKGWIIDIRNYPSGFFVFRLGGHFIDHPTAFARFTIGQLANPGGFVFGAPLELPPAAPHYAGKVVILVDEVSQSNAEYTAMAFRVGPGAVVVGSTTAGADGNVSKLALPGGQNTMISGIGVYYPDKRPTQRIGIIPDVEARPTIAGIRAGRDEVLEVAVRQILGPQKSDDEIRQLIPTTP